MEPAAESREPQYRTIKNRKSARLKDNALPDVTFPCYRGGWCSPPRPVRTSRPPNPDTTLTSSNGRARAYNRDGKGHCQVISRVS